MIVGVESAPKREETESKIEQLRGSGATGCLEIFS